MSDLLKPIPISFDRDARGALCAIEDLPFEIKRVFALTDLNPETSRADHAVSCDEFLVLLSGACTLELRSRTERARIRLDDRGVGHLVPAGTWIRLSDFSGDASLLVACSETYARTTYFAEPQI